MFKYKKKFKVQPRWRIRFYNGKILRSFCERKRIYKSKSWCLPLGIHSLGKYGNHSQENEI